MGGIHAINPSVSTSGGFGPCGCGAVFRNAREWTRNDRREIPEIMVEIGQYRRTPGRSRATFPPGRNAGYVIAVIRFCNRRSFRPSDRSPGARRGHRSLARCDRVSAGRGRPMPAARDMAVAGPDPRRASAMRLSRPSVRRVRALRPHPVGTRRHSAQGAGSGPRRSGGGAWRLCLGLCRHGRTLSAAASARPSACCSRAVPSDGAASRAALTRFRRYVELSSPQPERKRSCTEKILQRSSP